MDEEDGRLGPTARQLGHADVLTDALTRSLRYSPYFNPWVPSVSPRVESDPDAPAQPRSFNPYEVNHENVPGK